MLKQFIYNLIALCIFLASSAQDNLGYEISGRTFVSGPNEIHLVGPASSVSYISSGDVCQFTLQSAVDHHLYVSVEIDGIYNGRLKVERGAAKQYSIKAASSASSHLVRIYKATEATNGDVIFSGAQNVIGKPKPKKKPRIEFIGNSITSGMGNDTKEIPCDQGEWYDHHNAYWSYAPILSRSLDADFLLSSVSGIGMYRNWNDEHEQEAIMPDVYDKLSLTREGTIPFFSDFQPDIVSICLGTNDFSDGDGIKKRRPFEPKKFISNYTAFVAHIYEKYPRAKIILLNSPVVSGAKNTEFVKCLQTVASVFNNKGRKISVFEFDPMTPHGCGSHPDIEDDKKMANQLESTFRTLLDDK